jgi:hypothetical protein
VVMHFVAFGPPFIFLFVLYFIIILFMLFMISFGWF